MKKPKKISPKYKWAVTIVVLNGLVDLVVGILLKLLELIIKK